MGEGKGDNASAKTGTSRLDGLITLVESGTSIGVRRMAASQIGELVAAYPAQAQPVLFRVRKLLRSSDWDTRTSSGQAVKAIAEQIPILEVEEEPTEPQRAERDEEESHFLSFDALDLLQLVERGALLLGSSGEEYKANRVDITTQRKQLKRDLGIDERLTGGDDVLGVKDEDLLMTKEEMNNQNAPVPKAEALVAEVGGTGNMSKREANRLKREAKKRGRSNPSADEGTNKKAREESTGDNQNGTGASAELDWEDVESKETSMPWPFSSTCGELKEDLLKERWEARHGAAIGLREILRKHAVSAGTVSPGDAGKRENQLWLEDLSCRLLCVLALDRFGDFVGDGVVAPVRETACMAIAASARAMDNQRVIRLVEILKSLLGAKNKSLWEVRHGALLGMKYVLSVSSDELSELHLLTYDSIIEGLEDQDDDVRAVAADVLVPTMELTWNMRPQRIEQLLSILWNSLLELDELSASTASVLKLIARVYESAEQDDARYEMLTVRAHDEDEEDVEDAPLEMSALITRLWPFFRHHAVKVRRAAIETFLAIVSEERRAETLRWLRAVCGGALDHVFRNILLESDDEALRTSQKVWARLNPLLTSTDEDIALVVAAVEPYLKHWFTLATCDTRSAAIELDKVAGQPDAAKTKPKSAKRLARMKALEKAKAGQQASSEPTSGPTAPAQEGSEEAISMQLSAVAGFGVLGSIWPKSNNSLRNLLTDALRSPFVVTRREACFVVESWASVSSDAASQEIYERVLIELNDSSDCAYAELSSSVSSLFTDVRSLLQAYGEDLPQETLVSAGVDSQNALNLVTEGLQHLKANKVSEVVSAAASLQPTGAVLATTVFETWLQQSSGKGARAKKRREVVSAVRLHILATIGYLTERREMLRNSLVAAAAAAIVASKHRALPKLVTPYIKGLMGSVRNQASRLLQERSAKSLAVLLRRLGERQTPKPMSLVVKNVCKFLHASRPTEESDATVREKKAVEQRGTVLALRSFAKEFNDELFTVLPWLWELMSNNLSTSSAANDEDVEKLITALLVASKLVAASTREPRSKILSLLPAIIELCASEHLVAGPEAGDCLSEIVYEMPSEGMELVVRLLLPMLEEDRSAQSRQHAASALRRVVRRMDEKLVPYAAFMVVPMMMRMVDQDEAVRDACAGVFGTLVRLMPLEEGAPDDPGMSKSMQKERAEAREFLGQLLGSVPRKHYTMPVPVGDGVELRHYQQECLDWLFFLNRYGLHGALCDDMGLGKTLMTLCAIAGSNLELKKKGVRRPSLVVCPATLVPHWRQEAIRFFGETALDDIIMYLGNPRDRANIRATTNFRDADLVVTSYDALGTDIEHFEPIRWNYQVLDEGHVIKNHKTRAAKAVRRISAAHRLLLSGTPIQNTVLELWAIFDFLMPGFLGSEKTFKETYGKPILASRDPKCGDREREKGMAAMEALHRQVLPFVLRRLKDDVLSELPPKVIQDYYCYMTPLQTRMYEDFSRLTLSADALDGDTAAMDDEEEDERESKNKNKSGGQHIFQALQYLRRLCSHPALVLDKKKRADLPELLEELGSPDANLHAVEQSPKLVALELLLGELGIGNEEAIINRGSGGHRVLIFAQMKEFLDCVEEDLFKGRMPLVTYMRLDGSIDATKRQGVVTKFNADPTIDCLLLTTHVGGLGLNLTGADIVIFLEHDWNPTKDLQAMDRAHRLGQKRTVNVYRFIMKNSLEEKIMNVQRFKTHIANAVVNRDNSSLTNMNTSELLNLFNVEDKEKPDVSAESANAVEGLEGSKSKGLKAALAQLGDLWDEQQYTDEYNVEEFAASMKGEAKERA